MLQRISTSPNAILLKPKETHKINIRFHNMAACMLRYEVDQRDGSITDEGLYTAPDKPGVHVIRILCADNPFINTFAYAEVSK